MREAKETKKPIEPIEPKVRTLRFILTTGLLAFCVSGHSFADQRTDTGPYLSGAIGQNRIHSGLPDEAVSVYRAGLGWQFNANFAAELSYQHLGKFPGPTPAYSDFDLTGFSFAAIGQIPLSSRTALFAKAGQFWWSTESDYFFFIRSGGPNDTGTLDFSESDIFLGMGASFEITPQLELELEYNYYDFNFPTVVNNRTFSDYSNDGSALILSLKWEL